MKKLISLALLLLLLPVLAFAVGSMTVTSDIIYKNSATGEPVRVIEIGFTADSGDGSIPDLTLNAATTGIQAYHPLLGWHLFKIWIDGNHSGTEPTEDSEIYLYEGGIDLLGGNGVDQVDNSDEREVYFEVNGQPATVPVISDLTLTITQQAVATNSAAGSIKIVLY